MKIQNCLKSVFQGFNREFSMCIHHCELDGRVCSTLVPTTLSDRHKDLRVVSAKSIRRVVCNLSDNEMLGAYVIVQDESCFFQILLSFVEKIFYLSRLGYLKMKIYQDSETKLCGVSMLLSLLFIVNKKFLI